MNVTIRAIALLASDGPWEIPDFRAREAVPEKKHLKLMSRGVQLGVAAIRAALADRPGWESIPPERRALFVGASPVGSDPDDLRPALEASRVEGQFDVAAFGSLGFPVVPPLWLVKGLSNNILGYASAYHDLQGVKGNRCDGRISGLAALLDGARAVAEGRADLAIAGGADALLDATPFLGVPTGEGAAFFVLEREGDGPRLVDGGVGFQDGAPLSPAGPEGELGAASGVVPLARRLLAGDRGFRVEVSERGGAFAWVAIG